MLKHSVSVLLICFLLVSPIQPAQQRMPEFIQVIYDDHLAAGWDDWSWAQVSLDALSPVHSGSHSIAVTYSAWQGLYLHYPSVNTLGLTHLRFYLHGGSAGGQHLNVFMNLDVAGNAENGPSIPVSPPSANAWSEITIPLVSLNPGGAIVTGLTWQDLTGGSQPTVYIDDIALVSTEDPNGPQLSDGLLTPRSLPADGATTLLIRCPPSRPARAVRYRFGDAGWQRFGSWDDSPAR